MMIRDDILQRSLCDNARTLARSSNTGIEGGLKYYVLGCKQEGMRRWGGVEEYE